MSSIVIFLLGVIAGWNLIPQPAAFKKLYDKAAVWIKSKFTDIAGVGLIFVILSVQGCSSSSVEGVSSYARERAMAEIAIASVTVAPSPSPKPDDRPNVGDKCPACNDPPGKCGVGRVGDGRICDTCLTCNGDGKIDDGDDVESPNYTDDTQENRTVTLFMSDASRGEWASDWYRVSRQRFIDAGWKVFVILTPSGPAYFRVVNNQGQHKSFDKPLELSEIQ